MVEVKIGLAGLGTMGAGMAASILRAGYDLKVWNRSPDKADALVREGAAQAATFADFADRDVVATMLLDDGAVREATLGRGGLRDVLPVGAVHVCSSTISVALSDELTAAHAQAGQSFVAAPVNGRGDFASEGKLFVLAAGDPQALDKAAGLFDAIGQKTIRFGDAPRAATVAKLAVNALIADAIGSMAEAYALVRRSGAPVDAFHDLVSNGLFAAPIYKIYGAMIASEIFEPANFPVRSGLKDADYALAAADALGASMPLLQRVRGELEAAVDRGNADLDWAAIRPDD